MLEFVEEHDLIYSVDPVHYAIRLLVPPGSALIGTPQMTPFLEELDEESFSYRWTHPDPRMDALHTAVSQVVEDAAHRSEDLATTFYRVKDLALSTLLGRSPARTPWSAGASAPPPRLTESWFC